MYPTTSNDGEPAYPSRPIDVETPGDVTVYFGPVDPWFSFDNPQTQGWTTYWPTDTGFNIRPIGGEEIVDLDGARYVKVNLRVSGEHFSPYPGLYGWIA
jgi:hypothetical protein